MPLLSTLSVTAHWWGWKHASLGWTQVRAWPITHLWIDLGPLELRFSL